MKFTVDLEEFWMEEDGESLDAELKKYIIRSVSGKIEKSIQEKVEAEIEKKVDEFVSARLSVIINDQLAECIEKGVIQPRCHSIPISITTYIKERFLDNSGWSTPTKYIEKIAKEFGADLKLQYNNAFANKIVANMKEQGLLKDEVVQILLGES